MKFINGLLDVVAFIAAIIGGAIILFSALPNNSAPQAGALAAIGIGIAAVPYFIASITRRAQIAAAIERMSSDKANRP